MNFDELLSGWTGVVYEFPGSPGQLRNSSRLRATRGRATKGETVNTIVYWLAGHWMFALGLFTGLFGCMVLLACIERLAELTLGGPRARRVENLELTRELARWKRRYTALLDETEVVAGDAHGEGR